MKQAHLPQNSTVKYTPEAGKVTLVVSIDAKNMPHLSVNDTGCGRSISEQGKIFGKRFLASNVRNAIDGNGFGLYVAKGPSRDNAGRSGSSRRRRTTRRSSSICR